MSHSGHIEKLGLKSIFKETTVVEIKDVVVPEILWTGDEDELDAPTRQLR